MKSRVNDVDEVLQRDFEIAPADEAKAAGVRVWLRLEAGGVPELETRLDKAQPAAAHTVRYIGMAAAAAVLIAAIGTAMLWPRADRYVTTDAAQLITLDDGSRVEMRAQSELTVEPADDGLRIRLDRGGIIVHAADQRAPRVGAGFSRPGHLYVQTKDMTVSVVGTVFLVNADEDGSRVAVIEGEVHVQQGAVETTLMRGDHLATNASVKAPPVSEAIAWSRNAPALIALLQQSAVVPPAVAPQTPPAVAPQTPTTPRLAFEVASIRPSAGAVAPGGRGGGPTPPSGCGNGLIQVDPRRVVINNVTLQWLIARANNPWTRARGGCNGVGTANLLIGGPGWVRSDKWDVEALVPNGYSAQPSDLTSATDNPLLEMLRALLTDRFKLVLRTETREMPVYLLTVAKGGPRFNGPVLGRDGKPRVSTRQDSDGNLIRTDELAKGTFQGITQRNSGNPYILWDAHVSMSEWAGYLVGQLGRPVLDRTGLEGDFRFHLEVDAKGVSRPRWIEAIEELGLSVEETRAPTEVWVIERAEKPSEN